MEVFANCPSASALQIEKMQEKATGGLYVSIQQMDSPPNFLPTTPSAPSSPESYVLETMPKLESATMSQLEDIQLLGIEPAENLTTCRTEVTQAALAADVAVPFCTPAQLDEDGMDLAPFDELDRMFQQSTESGEIPGLGYVVLRHGKLVKAGTFGVADTETRIPWRFDSICRMYSMTKTVSICGLMMLVEEGCISLQDPVSKFLPNFELARLQVVHNESIVSSQDCKPVKCPVLIKHLVTHTSGLSYGSSLGDPPSSATEEAYQPLIQKTDRKEFQDLTAWCDDLTALPLRFQPGENWEYSYSIDIVGRIIEIVSGERLDHFLFKRVMEPLGMQDTTFALPQAKQGRLTSFYRRVEGKLKPVDTPASSQWVEPNQQLVLCAGGTVGSVAGGLVSTINDFARLCLMLQNGGEFGGVRFLKEQTVKLMSSNMLPEMTGRPDCWCLETAGLGFGLLGSVAVEHPDANWYDTPGEIGWGGLAGTAWATDQRDGLVVISFCQVMYEFWIDEEVRKATRRALGYAPPDAATANQEPKEGARPHCEVAATAADPPNPIDRHAMHNTEEASQVPKEGAEAAVAGPQHAVIRHGMTAAEKAVEEGKDGVRPDSEVTVNAANFQHPIDSDVTHGEGNHTSLHEGVLSLELPPLHRGLRLVASPLRKNPDMLTRQLESTGVEVDCEKTPKRPRLSSDAIHSQRSTEKLKAEDSGNASISPFTGLTFMDK